jgi:AraC family transcriptional regulator of adaptative response / DNA-3-methyladenine glycosylase II
MRTTSPTRRSDQNAWQCPVDASLRRAAKQFANRGSRPLPTDRLGPCARVAEPHPGQSVFACVVVPSASGEQDNAARRWCACTSRKRPGSTVARGLRLIGKGALDARQATVGALAATSRSPIHQAFWRPGQVARTASAHRATLLLDTADLSISEVALAASFGSLRRFNAVVFQSYGRSPTELRRISPKG